MLPSKRACAAHSASYVCTHPRPARGWSFPAFIANVRRASYVGSAAPPAVALTVFSRESFPEGPSLPEELRFLAATADSSEQAHQQQQPQPPLASPSSVPPQEPLPPPLQLPLSPSPSAVPRPQQQQQQPSLGQQPLLEQQQQPVSVFTCAAGDPMTRDGLTKSLQERLLSKAAAKSGTRALVLEASERTCSP